MVWVKIDDSMPEHPDIVTLDDGAFRLLITGLCYCNRLLTDGFIPSEVANKMGKARSLRAVISAGKWDRVPGGYEIHDYLEYQPSKAQVEAERLRGARRQAAHRSRRHSESNGVTNGVSHTAPTRPVPVLPKNQVLGNGENLEPVENPQADEMTETQSHLLLTLTQLCPKEDWPGVGLWIVASNRKWTTPQFATEALTRCRAAVDAGTRVASPVAFFRHHEAQVREEP